MTAPTLVAHEKAIQKIFSDDYVFRIPDYQRPYSWTTEQARELIEDLLGFIEANPGLVSSMPTYFLGTIVLIKSPNASDAAIVDGQQRLTTLTLLLSAIRANVDPAKRANLTKRIYEEGDELTSTPDQFRLSLRDRDRGFFQQYVQKEDGFDELVRLQRELSDSQRRLQENAALFDKRLKTLEEAKRLELASFILQRCFLVVVETSDEDSAFRIFSVLNSRGLDLSATDILKAKVIGGISQSQRDHYTRRWEEAEEDLGRDDFNSLFGYIRTIYSKSKAQGTLLKEFEQFVPELKSPAKFMDELLLPMVDAYGILTGAAYAAPTGVEPVNEHLRWLGRLEFNDWMPPALAFTVRHRDDPSAMHAFVESLERLSYFMLVTRKGVYDRIERFARVTREVEADGDLFAKTSRLQLTPFEQNEFYEALDGPIYGSLSAKARTPILLRLDSLVSDGAAHYDFPIVSVEHVLPQTPPGGSEWMQWFSKPETRLKWVHRLGNLALLSRRKNSAASNYAFDVKKMTYFSRRGVCAFALTTEVLRESTWDEHVVQARQDRLMARLEQHWRLQERKSLLDELAALAR